MRKNNGHWFYDNMTDAERATYFFNHPKSKLDRLIGEEHRQIAVKDNSGIGEIVAALDDSSTKQITVKSTFMFIYDYVSNRRNLKTTEATNSRMVKELGVLFGDCAIEKLPNEKDSTFNFRISKVEPRFLELKDYMEQMKKVGFVPADLDKLKKLAFNISKIEGYEKKAMFCVYLASEMQKGVKCSQQLMKNLIELSETKAA